MALSPMVLFSHREQSSQKGPRKRKGLDIVVLQPFRKFDLWQMENPVWELMSQEVSVDKTPRLQTFFYVHFNFLLWFQIKLRKKGHSKIHGQISYLNYSMFNYINSSTTLKLHKGYIYMWICRNIKHNAKIFVKLFAYYM